MNLNYELLLLNCKTLQKFADKQKFAGYLPLGE
jgi:hypothetical protein